MDGVDDRNEGPNDQQHNLLITSQNTLGTEECKEKVEISVRIGDKVLFKGVGLGQAIAACIQLHFRLDCAFILGMIPAQVSSQQIYC